MTLCLKNELIVNTKGKFMRKIKKVLAVSLAAFICLSSAPAAYAGSLSENILSSLPDIDIDSLGLTEEQIEYYMKRAGGIDFDDPQAANEQIKSMAAEAGYDISDGEADVIRGVLENADTNGMGVEEIKSMYEAGTTLNNTIQETGNFLDAIKSFFVNIFNVIKDWFMGLFHF